MVFTMVFLLGENLLFLNTKDKTEPDDFCYLDKISVSCHTGKNSIEKENNSAQ